MTAVPATGLGVMAVWMVLFGGIAAPKGMPPLPPTRVLTTIAPERCLAYFSVAGVAEPLATSGNQTEQLLAEPDVRALSAQIDQFIRSSLDKSVPPGMLPPDVSTGDLAELITVLSKRPAAIYVSSVEMKATGPAIHGGLAVHLGDKLDGVKAKVEKLAKMIPPPMTQTVDIDGDKWQSVTTPIGQVVYGFIGKCFVAAVGEGEFQALMNRAKGKPPAWLNQLRRQSPVERVSTIAYVNLKDVVATAKPMAGPNADKTVEALGLSNVLAVTSVTGFDKGGCVSHTLLQIEGDPHGWLQMATVKPLAASDLATIPADAIAAIAFKLDPLAVFDNWLETLGRADPKTQASILATIGQAEAQSGVKLRDGVLKCFGDTFTVYGSLGDMGQRIVVATIAVKDSRQAARTLSQVMQIANVALSGGNAGGNTLVKEKAGDKDVYILRSPKPGAPSVACCLTDKELVIGSSLSDVQSHLSPPMGFKPLAESPSVAESFKADAAPLTLVYVDLPQIFERFYPMLPVLAGAMPQSGFKTSMLPPAKALLPHLTPLVSVVRRVSNGIEFVEHYTLPGVNMTSLAPVGIAVLLPAVQAARETAKRAAVLQPQ